MTHELRAHIDLAYKSFLKGYILASKGVSILYKKNPLRHVQLQCAVKLDVRSQETRVATETSLLCFAQTWS